MPSNSHWGVWRSLIALAPVLVAGPWIAYQQHFKIPDALSALTNPTSGLPQLSEERILGVAKHLSEGIGYRTVGTYEHALADKWMLDAANQVKQNCERIVTQTDRNLECEVWRQEGSGYHRFDMMGKRLYKTYVNLSNIIVRISDGTPEGKEHAVLVNAHLDSTLPSPGAADDALPVGIMLDCMRVLIETPKWSPKHAIIFLFNHAEESLQDGSHLYSTRHPTASTVRAIVNLEAAGTTGREILFQATSEEMIEAYSHVPRPYGTIFANDIFSSGIILSDTDFRQFEQYLNVTGLDMAVVGNSYLYHMRKDLVEHIQPGTPQHMAENTLALLRHLSSKKSPLPRLTKGYAPPTTVFFAHVGTSFFMYSFATAKILYTTLFAFSLVLVRISFVHPTPVAKRLPGFWREQGRGLVAVTAGTIGTLVVPNIVALIMRVVLNKGMSWFKNPLAPIGLYGPAALLGAMISQYLIGEVDENSVFNSSLLTQAGLAVALQFANIGSAAIFFLSALPLFSALALNPFFAGPTPRLSLWTYALGSLLPSISGVLLLLGVVDVFVPLTGRIGGDAPADNIVATIIAALGGLAFPLVLPFSHRFGRPRLLRGVIFFSVIMTGLIGFFATMDPFDQMHQKRLFILHSENLTTHEHHMHIAAADGAPGFEQLAHAIALKFGASDVAPEPVTMDDNNYDWDVLYPFSAFLTPYKVPLAVPQGYVSPWTNDQAFTITAKDHTENLLPGTRNITITVTHPGLIWTVIAFDAHVLKWSLDDNPPDEHARHRLKEASFYGHDTYSFDVLIKVPEGASDDASRVPINFIGMQEKGVWPAKKAFKAQGGPAMAFFEELDTWLEKKTDGKVDALLVGCVGGATAI
ncbi:hypothetical protein HYPSUDRAFT_37128 [Hypholoma sublateritium FD-334 SS-4]|uniref:Peptide hydrolase n=1 Tax=Hypholoma sublateritium (strain FD-334 SS-4) TaxID=945553 RepID=A0A0D2PAW6_HYPSF|nr:hypothetical protein HYPSUDRAFT_37128 [Hypholoma sublateritium FD-334 SS-4]